MARGFWGCGVVVGCFGNGGFVIFSGCECGGDFQMLI